MNVSFFGSPCTTIASPYVTGDVTTDMGPPVVNDRNPRPSRALFGIIPAVIITVLAVWIAVVMLAIAMRKR